MNNNYKLRRPLLLLGLLLVMGASAFAQTLINPGNHNRTYTGFSRGYYFTAPIDMIITKIDIPTNSSTTGQQTAEILKFTSTPPTSGATQLGYWTGVGATATITTNIVIKKGEIIGVIGHRYTSTARTSAINSYGRVGTASIDGNSVTLYRFGYQGNIAGGASNGANLISATTGDIGRVNIYWQYPIIGKNNASVAAIDSPTTFCAGVQDVYATIKNEGENQIDSVRVNWSVGGVLQKTYFHKTTLDTLKGTGSNSAMVKLGSYNFTASTALKVWTSMPNGVKDTVNLGDTLEISKGPSLSGTFTIGGTSPDYKDFEEAADALNSFGVCGPVTFNVAAGTYLNRVALDEVEGTSATNTISFVGAGSSGTTKTTLNNRATASADRATILLDGTDWVTFKDIEILATGSWGHGVQFMNGADHNTVEGCVITANRTTTSTNFVPIIGSNNTTGRTGGNTGNWNTFKNNEVNGGYYNVWFYGTGTTNKVRGNRFEGNTFDDAYYYGIYTFYHDSIAFNNNVVKGVRRSTFGDGVYAYYWSNAEFNGNEITAPDYGAYFLQLNRTNYNGTTPTVISNNILISGSDYAFYANTCNNLNFYHNSVYSTGTYSSYFSSGSGYNIENNIFTNNRSNGYTIYIRNTTPNSIDNNIYHNFNSNGRIANHNGIHTSLANWQAAQATFNENSLSQNPGFIANSNLRLSPSTTNPRGDDVGVYDDINGDKRCPFAPTIGADEGDINASQVAVGFLQVDTIWQNSFTTILNIASANEPKGHSWYVNGTLMSNDLHFQDTFKTAGTTIIKLITESCSGIDSLIDTVIVSPATKRPVASFVATKTDPLIYENLQLIDISTEGPTSYEWKILPDSVFDATVGFNVPTYSINSGSLRSPNPEIEFDYEGTYDVCLIVGNAYGTDTLCRSKFIQIKAQQNMCVFPSETAISSGLLYDDGGPNGNHGRNANCDFLIDPCSREVSLDFSEFSLGSGDYLRVYDGSDATGTPLWDATSYPNGMQGNTSHASFKSSFVASSGKMYLVFRSNGSNESQGWEAEWTSKPKISATPAIAAFDGPDTVCVDIPAAFQNISTGDDMEFEWFVDGFSEATATDLNYTFRTVGTIDVKLEVTNCGGTSTITKQIVVENPRFAPKPDFVVSNDKPIVNEKVYFNDMATYCRDRWEWSITPGDYSFTNGTDSSFQDPVVQFSKAGTYTVKQKVGNSAGFDSIVKTNVITVLAYCAPSVAYKSKDLGISRVIFGDIDNRSSVGVDEYTDYTSTHSTKMEIGAPYTITVERDENNFPMSRNVWIDYNRDGDFTDAGELVASEGSGYSLSWTDTIKAPASAESGITRMRIGTNSGSNKNISCGPHFNGEFEDYQVIISPDVASPVITLAGADSITISYCDTFVEPGATAIDNVDGNITSSIVYSGKVLRAAGRYTLEYYAKDANNNDTLIERIVVRESNKLPIQIIITGKAIDTIEVGSTYTDPSFTTYHPCAGVASAVTTSGLDEQVLGAYTITYEVKDSAGNTSTAMRTVHVVDRTVPTLTYTGKDTIVLDVDSAFVMPTVTVDDNYDPNPVVSTNGTVDPSTVGDYKVVFCATDESGNETCKDLLVRIVDRIDPMVSLKGSDTVFVDVFGSYNDRGIDITDNYYTEFDITYAGDWAGETDVLDTFTQTYIATDGSDNAATIDRTIIIVDRVAPTIWLNGDAVVYLERWDEYTDASAQVADNYDVAPTLNVSGTFVNTQSEGIYDITYYAVDQSGNRSSSVTRTIIVGPKVNTSVPGLGAEGVDIYPNPTTGLAVIEMNLNANAPMTLWITDISGRTMLESTQISPSTEKFELNISDLNDGVYFMHLQTGSEHVIKRIVKE